MKRLYITAEQRAEYLYRQRENFTRDLLIGGVVAFAVFVIVVCWMMGAFQ